MNMQELIQESLLRKAGRICKDSDCSGSRLWVPGLVFLRYMSHTFDRILNGLNHCEGEYREYRRFTRGDARYLGRNPAQNLLYIPRKSRWEYVMERINGFGIGDVLDEAMENIERFNPAIGRILPREYTSPEIREDQLALFIKMLGDIPREYFRTGEILRNVYSYLVRYYMAGMGKKQEPFCSPESVEKLLVAMVDPVGGSIFDPCCGVGSMLVESYATVSRRKREGEGINKAVFFGQESNLTNFRLCRMNLAIHGIDGSGVGWNNVSCIGKDMHSGLKADYIFCSPPYTEKGSNFSRGWINYITSHMALGGSAGLVFSKDSLNKTGSSERAEADETREYLVESGLVKCIVSLPDRLFPDTDAERSACLWLLAEGKSRVLNGNDQGILFIDYSRVIPADSSFPYELSMTDIDDISSVYHRWQGKNCIGTYRDVKGFCKQVELDAVKEQHFDLRPERYV
jgi:type I restriction enzyme M protein